MSLVIHSADANFPPKSAQRSPCGAMAGKSRTPYGSHRGLRGVRDESTLAESRGHPHIHSRLAKVMSPECGSAVWRRCH